MGKQHRFTVYTQDASETITIEIDNRWILL